MRRHELTRDDILQHALQVRESYAAQDLTLTLRQMYYRFVGLGLVSKEELAEDEGKGAKRFYKRVGDVLTEARYDGTFPIDGLEDRGREVRVGDFTRSDRDDDFEGIMKDATGWVRHLPSYLARSARWEGQPIHVSVWVEKDALAGVFEPVCEELGVNWFPCKGYPSVSALWAWIQAAWSATAPTGARNSPGSSRRQGRYFKGTDIEWHERHGGFAEQCIVLYFGDHDPDGWEIPRSAERNVAKLMAVRGVDLDVTFERVALLRSQVDAYDCPPFEAKMSSARYAGYVEEHETEDAWELDALDPAVLRDLIRENIERYFDADIFEANQERIATLRARMVEQMRDPGWIRKATEE